MRTLARRAGRALMVVVMAIAGVALLLGVVVPRVAGATPFVVLTGSMEPGLPVGSLVVSRPVPPEQIGAGAVITYQVRSGQELLATHRVVGIGTTVGGERTYRTQGDANGAPDPVPVRDVQVRGVVWYHVPYLGYAAHALGDGTRGTLTLVAAAALAAYAAWQVVQAGRERTARPGPGAVGPGTGGAAVVRPTTAGADGVGLGAVGPDAGVADGAPGPRPNPGTVVR